MLDIRTIRTDPEGVKARLRIRNSGDTYAAIIDTLAELDIRRRALMGQTETIAAEQNAAGKAVPQLKKEGDTAALDTLMARMKTLAEEKRALDSTLAELEAEQQNLLLSLPNLPHESVPVGNSDADNAEVRRNGTPRDFEADGFTPQAHWDIGGALDILDPERAAKVTGARFHFYKGAGARLERAIINLYLDTHTAKGYTEIFPPFMVNRTSMTGTGQLPKFEEDAFQLTGGNFLIPTAEVPVTNLHRDEILDGNMLPIQYCAYSACFRAEAGSAGRDTRGLIRQHQFNKVELVKFADPADSYDELEKLTQDAEYVLQLLKLPYRVVTLCSGDLGFSSAKTYDIEVWMPSYGRYLEISSCSNFEDFQARRAAIRFKNGVDSKAQLVHTLNGSGVAIGRTVAAIIENYQQADGRIAVPEVLQKYMGCDIIG